MYTRKEIKNVLKEWKSYVSVLNEAEEEAATGPVIRIFDFDGTLTVYKEPEVGLLLKNPYMLSFIDPGVAFKLNKTYSSVPSNIKEILAVTGPTVRNYVISKISSTGFNKIKADKLINGLKNKDDQNFKALAKYVIEPKVPNWEKLLDEGEIEKLIAEAGKVLNLESSEFGNVGRISNEGMLMSQEAKIEQTLQKYKIADKFSRIYTKDNLAKQQETSSEDGGTQLKAVAGTSGKFSPAYTIATNAFTEFPNSTITFEIYDNSTSNVAEIESAILKASSGDSNEDDTEAGSEQTLLAALKKEIDRKENVAIKKFQAILVGEDYELRDLSDVHISKAKGRDISTVQESGPKLKFQKIKNKFFALIKMLKLDGKKTGRPNLKVQGALDVTIHEDPSAGEYVKELYQNYIPGLGETGLELKYRSKAELNRLSEQLLEFIVKYDSFKQALEKNKKEGRSLEQKPATLAAPAAPKVAKPKPPPVQQPARTAAQERDAETRAGNYSAADDIENDEGLPGLDESVVRPRKRLLREFKLVLKTKR